MADAISGVTLYGEPPLCCTRRSTCSQLYAEESHQGGVEAYVDAMPMKRGGTDTTCLFPWDVCETRAMDENVSGAGFAAVRNVSCEILVAFAVLACVCRSTGALLCAAVVACRIARGIDATGAIEWCRTCPSKLISPVDRTVVSDGVGAVSRTSSPSWPQSYLLSRLSLLQSAGQHSCAWQDLKSHHPCNPPATCHQLY